MKTLATDSFTLSIPADDWHDRTGRFPAAAEDFALVADGSPLDDTPRSRSTLYWVLVASAALHLILMALFLVGGFGGSPQLRELGADEGLPENMNVSVISEADLKRLSSDPYRQESPPPQPTPNNEQPAETAPQTPAPPQEAQPKEAEPKETKEAETKPAQNKEAAAKDVQTPDGLASFAERAAEQFSAQITKAFEAKETRQKTAQLSSSKNVKIFRPGGARNGKSDEFTRAVIWALGATKPQGNGKWGTTIVTFLVSTSGQAEGLHIVKSSGDDWLDKGALMAVRQARLPTPPAGYAADGRTFLIEYISLPEG